VVVKYPLKGVFKVTAKGHDYWYAWRGPPLGPRLQGAPASPEFHASYVEAHEAMRAPDAGRFCSLVAAYRMSDDFKALAPSTKQAWARWLDRIDEHFGDLRIVQFERTLKIRPIIIRWRSQWANKPRTADFSIQVLSRVLSYATDTLGKLSGNPCEGIKTLYRVDRSEVIWIASDIDRLKQTCSPEVAYAVDLAAHTGLRLGDIVRLSWSHIGADEIVIATGKSRLRRSAHIPLYDDLRDVLARIPKRATTVLTHSRNRPWAAKGLGDAFSKAKNAAGFADLHFHDLRGTAATRFYTAGLSERVIAEIMGWEEAHVSKIIRRYVDRTALVKAAITELNKSRV
jgi:integrase